MRISRFLTCSCRLLACLAMLLRFFQVVVFAQKESSMGDLKTSEQVQSRGRRMITTPDKYLVYGLDRAAVKQVLDQAPMEFTPGTRLKNVILEIPNPDGVMQRFRIEESQVLAPEIAAQFPGWKYYQGFGIDDPTATARFDVTYFGFRGQIITTKGTYLIDPYQFNDLGNYIVYYKNDVPKTGDFHCLLDESETSDFPKADIVDAPAFSTGTQIPFIARQ